MPSDRAPLPAGWPRAFGAGDAERREVAVLSSLRGITPGKLRALAWRVGSAVRCVDEIRAERAGTPGDREWIGQVDPDALLTATAAAGARFVTAAEPEYPSELLDLQNDPPGWVFIRGRPLVPRAERVSIVGARRCSPLGAEIAHDLGRRLAGAGAVVVSGAAAGIDGAAHRGALAAGGRTVAVLGSGIDVPFPSHHRDLIDRIAASGTVVGEYPPGTKPEPWQFPARNRIVAALGRALVVVEGAAKSGSRISVDHALDLGREVFAVPGAVTSPLSETPLGMIRDGATMIRGAEDLLEDLGIAAGVAAAPPPDLEGDDRRVLLAVKTHSLPDAIAREAGLSIPDVLTALIRLEVRDLVRGRGGRYEATYAARDAAGEDAAPPEKEARSTG